MISLQKNTSTGLSDYRLGDQMPDTSYYMGVSEDTGTDFFLFIESAGISKNADVVTFDKGTEILRDKHENNEVFNGHKFSKFQLDGQGDEDEIKKSYKENEADGGLRRLTKNEWEQVETVFRAKPDLRKAAIDLCSRDNWVHSASTYDDYHAWYHHIPVGRNLINFRTYTDAASVLVGRSQPSPKP